MSTNYLNAKNGIEILHKNGTTQIIAGGFDPSVIGLDAEIGSIFLCSTVSGGLYNKVTTDQLGWVLTASGEVTKRFLDLLDTPNFYTDHIGELLCVNAEANGLGFTNVIDGGSFI